MSDAPNVQEVIRELHRFHAEAMGTSADGLNVELERAFEMLPADIEWAVARPRVAVFARSDATLFQIVLDTTSGAATMTSRPLNAGSLAVGFAWGEQTTNMEATTLIRETQWTFRYVDETGDEDQWQHLTGRVVTSTQGAVTMDRPEWFARGLARQAGWDPPGTDET